VNNRYNNIKMLKDNLERIGTSRKIGGAKATRDNALNNISYLINRGQLDQPKVGENMFSWLDSSRYESFPN